MKNFLQLRYYLILRDLQVIDQVVQIARFRNRNSGTFQQLTNREVQILQLLAEGYNNPMVAVELSISRGTVATHRKNLKRKLNIQSHGQLVIYALAFRLVGF